MKVNGKLRLKEFKVISKEEKEGLSKTGIIVLSSIVNQYDAENVYGTKFKSMAFDHVDKDGSLVYNSIKIKTVNEKHKLNILGFELNVFPDSPQIKALEDDAINKVDVVLKVPFDVEDHQGLATDLCVNVGNDIDIDLEQSQLELDIS